MMGFATQSQNDRTYDWVKCKKCKSGCEHCDFDTLKCSRCENGYELRNGKCKFTGKKDECKFRSPDGKHCYDCKGELQAWSFLLKKCVYCPKECSGCSQSGFCLSCKAGYKIDRKSGSCTPCKIPGCKTCHENANVCINCLPGFYFSFLTSNCQPCHETCATCSGPKKSDCVNCPYKFHELTYKYEEITPPVVMKLQEKLIAKFPGLTHMPMLMSRIFHPNFDRYCVKKCLEEKDLEADQTLVQDEILYGNECKQIEGKHPMERNAGMQQLHYDFGESTDQQEHKQRKERESQWRDREVVKRRVEEHLERMHDEDRHEYNEGMHTENTDYQQYQEAVEKARGDFTREKEGNAEIVGMDEYSGDQ